jgi:sugar O-acyltransferase (sialic acid O-acetyltransferase NeuD family)
MTSAWSDMQPRKLAIFGAGGHAREAALIAERMGVPSEGIVFVVEEAYLHETAINGIAVRTLESGHCDGWPFVAAVGDPKLRERAVALCVSRGMSAATLRDPDVIVHRTVAIGAGCIIASGVILTVNITLGPHVHLNSGASLSHDCQVGAYSIISPGAHIAGHIHIGSRVFIGIGASIVNGRADTPLVIGNDVLVAAGACVIGGVAEGARVMGVPGRSR